MFNEARAMLMLEAHRSGQTLQQIADQYGFSRERARQLCKRALCIEQQRNSKVPWFELSPRTRNALGRFAYEHIEIERRNNPSKIYKDFSPTVEGVLKFYPSLTHLKPVPALGKACIAELQAWFIRHGREPLR
jgi:hypothetical protein